MNRKFWLGTVALSCVLAAPGSTFAEISEQSAMESAHQAIAKYGVSANANGWTFYVDKELQRWHHIQEGWQERSKREKQLGREDTDFGPWLAQIEAVLHDRHVWAVVYKVVVPPGQRVLHPNAMVFVDADSGIVLALIEPEGSPQFPK